MHARGINTKKTYIKKNKHTKKNTNGRVYIIQYIYSIYRRTTKGVYVKMINDG